MTTYDLRPLSLGEILDRTFSLYRNHFALFAGITAIPYLLFLAFGLAQVLLMSPTAGVPRILIEPPQLQADSTFNAGAMVFGLLIGLAAVIVGFVAYLLAQGATVFAVSELYLGRTTTIGASFRRVRGELGTLFGVMILSGLAIGGGFILLIVPGIYIACRLAVCVPAAILEDLGPRTSLERSFALTKDNAGRAFLIYLLYVVLAFVAAGLFKWPFAIMILANAKNPQGVRLWLALLQVGNFFASALVGPVLTIAASLLYYDLRVRKEAFDLQMMMGALDGTPPPPATGGAPSMFS
jgi:hypothetical protein